jgi:hypothetical protein
MNNRGHPKGQESLAQLPHSPASKPCNLSYRGGRHKED